MWLFKRKTKTIDVEALVNGLHGSSVDAYSCPTGDGKRNVSGYDWDKYRHQIARQLLERYDILPKG